MKRSQSLPVLAILGLVVWLTDAGGVPAQEPARPGAPLAGITPVEFEAFRLGLDDFLEVETAEEGLGPAYNGTSCAVCHNVPAVGGIASMATMRAGRTLEDGSFQDLDLAGSLYQLFSVPMHVCQSVIPPEANVIARRVPIPLFGAGLIEAIPDETLLNLEDPGDADRDGISGRAAIVVDLATGERRVGRFGWKSQHATLLAFGADAYRNEMGITNDLFPGELTYRMTDDQLRVCDPIPDPEDVFDPATGRRGIDNFESFMKFLAPVSRGPIDDRVRAGEALFHSIGCANCHLPVLQTDVSTNPLFSRRSMALYSDLLLHDIGTGDGIRQGAALPNEIRTPALWGLRFRRPLLHDGSATTIREALLRHAGEAAPASRAFQELSRSEQDRLIAFLESL